MIMHTINGSKKTRLVMVIIMFVVFVIAYDLYANETRTELELNQDVFSRKAGTTQREMRRIDYMGNALLITPVERIKSNTEDFLLRNIAILTHEELNTKVKKNYLLKESDKGPKVQLTF